jgi:hypothetical protein
MCWIWAKNRKNSRRPARLENAWATQSPTASPPRAQDSKSGGGPSPPLPFAGASCTDPTASAAPARAMCQCPRVWNWSEDAARRRGGTCQVPAATARPRLQLASRAAWPATCHSPQPRKERTKPSPLSWAGHAEQHEIRSRLHDDMPVYKHDLIIQMSLAAS